MKNIEFSAERILSLTNCPSVRVFDSIDSTNTAAKAMAANNSAHGEVVIARLQTSGRGRLGRSFCSPEGGLYMSIILRPTIRGED
ncbi:MAG: biotin--[acetyl-CoA-carboxylase] ligase, partial [Clostridia bacterium]|nr:biotin--[acetyl-CoA-carboxylase] ligase [Clostridia bacterium]